MVVNVARSRSPSPEPGPNEIISEDGPSNVILKNKSTPLAQMLEDGLAEDYHKLMATSFA